MDLGRAAERVLERVSLHLPAAVAAVLLLAGGWLLGRLLGSWTRRLLARLDGLAPARGLQAVLRRVGVERPASEVVGAVVFWLVFLFFAAAATETVGLPVVAAWLSAVTYYLPRVLVAFVILMIGLFAGALARDAVTAAGTAAGLAYASVLGRLAQVVIVTLAVVTSIDQLGVESRFLVTTLAIGTGAIIGGAALAFGLGARTAVSNIIGSHYVRQAYRPGQRIRIGGVEGTIVATTTTAVMLETAEGRVLVPAKDFSEVASVLVAGDPGR